MKRGDEGWRTWALVLAHCLGVLTRSFASLMKNAFATTAVQYDE